LAWEGRALAALLAQGRDRQALQPRLARYEQGRVGAVVPEQVPDWVAYVPGQPERTVVLIPHPPYATRAFWTHRRTPPGGSPRPTPEHTSRVDLYARLAAVVPVLAVFATAETGHHYAALLRQAHFQWLPLADVSAWLRAYQSHIPPLDP
jgi:hypothetical protein